MENKIINDVINILIINHKISDEDLFEILANRYEDSNKIISIISFLPIAFTHKYFKNLVKFPDFYIEKKDNKEIKIPFSTTDYLICSKYYDDFIKNNNFSNDDILKIISRSSDFDAIYNAIENGVDYNDMEINPTIFYW